MDLEIIVAIIGLIGAVVAAVVSGYMSQKKDAKENLSSASTDKKEQANSPRLSQQYVGNLVDFFELVDGHRVEVDIAVDETGKSVFFYQAPLRTHITHLECFLEQRKIVLVEDSGQRRDSGVRLSDKMIKYFGNAKPEILLVRLNSRDGEVEGQISVPLRVYETVASQDE